MTSHRPVMRTMSGIQTRMVYHPTQSECLGVAEHARQVVLASARAELFADLQVRERSLRTRMTCNRACSTSFGIRRWPFFVGACRACANYLRSRASNSSSFVGWILVPQKISELPCVNSRNPRTSKDLREGHCELRDADEYQTRNFPTFFIQEIATVVIIETIRYA